MPGRIRWPGDSYPDVARRIAITVAGRSSSAGFAETPDRAVTIPHAARDEQRIGFGRGLGTALYSALFESLGVEDVHRIVAGISQPNPVSVALHQRFGFRQVGVFSKVGRKFDSYWDVAWFERALKR